MLTGYIAKNTVNKNKNLTVPTIYIAVNNKQKQLYTVYKLNFQTLVHYFVDEPPGSTGSGDVQGQAAGFLKAGV